MSGVKTKMKNAIDACKACVLYEIRRKNNLLPVIPGGDEAARILFAFINPTPLNLSICADFNGPRFLFWGDKKFWKVMASLGVIREETLKEAIARRWPPELIARFEKEVKAAGIWLTDLVKCPTLHGEYPPKSAIKSCYRFFIEEVKAIKPEKIVAFGVMAYKIITGRSIVLKDFWAKTTNEKLEKFKVIPCYFPSGRGDPKKAIECLRKVFEVIKISQRATHPQSRNRE